MILSLLLSLSATSSNTYSLPIGPPEPPPARFHWFDVDLDGDLDALAVEPGGSLRLLLHGDAGAFSDATVSFGLGGITGVDVALPGDADGDGDPDLVLLGPGGMSCLQLVGGAYVDATTAAGLEGVGPVADASWVDANGDGALDLHVVASGVHRLYVGSASGSFQALDLALAAAPAGGVLPVGATSAEGVTTSAGGSATTGSAGSNANSASTNDVDATTLTTAGGSRAVPKDLGPPAPSTPAARGGSGRSKALVVPGGASTSAAAAPPASNWLACVESIRDQAGATCLDASSVPMLGSLYPLSQDFFVEAATGNVGMGTTTPGYALEVDGQIMSGVANTAAGVESAIGGDRLNNAGGDLATIAGGDSNLATGLGGFVGGGLSNLALSDRSTIAGGVGNRAAYRAFVGGGDTNAATGNVTTVGGGKLNEATQTGGSVGGGEQNLSDATHATVGGGFGNSATGNDTVIGGGRSNLATGGYGAIPGGRSNVAAGAYSLAAGRRARALHDGAIVFADSADSDFDSTAPDQFLVEATGGMGVGRAPAAGLQLDVDGVVRASDTIVSTKPSGAPFSVASTDLNADLNADLLDGFHASAFSMFGPTVDASELANDSVSTKKIIDGSVAGADLAPGSVGGLALATGAVSLSKIDPSAGASGQVLGHDGSSAIWTNVRDSSWIPITSLPFTIGTSGAYYLANDVVGVSGADGIEVMADDVWIDLNGHVLAGVPGALIGIDASSHARVVVRNGIVRDWSLAISIERLGSVQDVLAEENASGFMLVQGGRIERCTLHVSNSSSTGVELVVSALMRSSTVSGYGTGILVGDQATIQACLVRGCDTYGFALTGSAVADCGAQGCGIGFDVRDCMVEQSVARACTSGFITANSNLIQCTGSFNATADFQLLAQSTLRSSRGLSNTGILVTGGFNRIDGNETGLIDVQGIRNVVVRNLAGSYSISAGNYDAQILTPASGFTSSNAWANFQY